ncbi:hypothetical protein N7475_000592 [Penicillium sp. IBT 31633x]|nr:hypothetical protein N7475_000592 [Penicillium sp. IBT 31633x]
MPGRSSHGTYEQERNYFLTTLHAQSHILKDNFPGNRQQVIKSLGLLLLRVDGLRMSGQTHDKRDNHRWAEKCNKLYAQVTTFQNTLIEEPSSTRRVANDIEAMMIFVNFCIPKDLQYRVQDEDPKRGDRSGAPSPEPSRWI